MVYACDWSWGWTSVEALATCILIAGIGLAIWQIFEARKSTNAQIAVDLFRELRSTDNIEIIRRIYDIYPKHDINKISKDELHKIEYLLNRLDMVGTMVNTKIVDRALAIEVFAGTPAMRCWFVLAEHIKNVRQQRGFYLDNYEKFVEDTHKYFKDKGIQVLFYYGENREYYQVDLITKFEERDFKYRPGTINEVIRGERSRKAAMDKT